MKIEVSIANIPQEEIIKVVKPFMEGGTAFQGTGFSQEWGEEPTTFIKGSLDETFYSPLIQAIKTLLEKHGESAAWLETGYPNNTNGLLFAQEVPFKKEEVSV